jgi:hypothetical protein
MARKSNAAPAAPAPTARVDRPLTAADKITAFRIATRGFPKHFAKEIRAGMTDAALEDALGRTLGIWGGSSGPGELDVSFQGSGLRIWASWGFHNSQQAKPVLSGRATVALAREVYGIRDPQDQQMRLF